MALGPDWKRAMVSTHDAAKRLATAGKVKLLQGGKPLDLAGVPLDRVNVKGIYRVQIA